MSANTIRSDFDRIAAHERPGRWNHNNHYHALMLRRLPARRKAALDVGCGSGELLGLLAASFERAVGIDFSARMLAAARKRLSRRPNVRLVRADARTYAFRPCSFDLIVSAAAFHHLPLRRLLPRLRSALAPGGRLVILDLYKTKTPADWLSAALAAPVNFVAERLKNRGRPQSRELREAWRVHAGHEALMSLRDVRRAARELLPGARVRRLFFWRYLLVWEKNETE
jgi:SAM-dependent methyltransferase